MWEWKNSDGTIRKFKINTGDKRCPICGQYIRKKEEVCIIVPPTEARKKYKKLKDNLMVHYDEWIEFCKENITEEMFAEKLSKHKTPRKKSFTELEQKYIDAFKTACSTFGFYECFEKPYGIKCKQHSSSLYLEYNVYSDEINIDFRGKKGLFDGFYMREIVTKIYNKMHEILDDGQLKEYSAKDTIQKIVSETEKIVNEIM